MNENSVVSLRQKDEIDDPLTEILRTGARRLITRAVVQLAHTRLGQLLWPVLSLGSLSHPVEHRAILGAMGLRKIQVPAQTQAALPTLACADRATSASVVRPLDTASWTRPNNGSRMMREYHVRLCVQRRLACSAGINWGTARADHPDPGRAADVPAGYRLPAQGLGRRRGPGLVHRVPDHRRLYRLPALSVPPGWHPAMRPALSRYCCYADDGRRSLLRG